MRGRQGASRASCADFDAGVVDGVDPTLKWLKWCAFPTSAAKVALIDQHGYESAPRAARMLLCRCIIYRERGSGRAAAKRGRGIHAHPQAQA